jgi:hypothetical protein
MHKVLVEGWSQPPANAFALRTGSTPCTLLESTSCGNRPDW